MSCATKSPKHAKVKMKINRNMLKYLFLSKKLMDETCLGSVPFILNRIRLGSTHRDVY